MTLDAWRGLACLGVVLCHATTPLTGELPRLRLLPLYHYGFQGRLGVHVFFVISGYCIVTAAISALRRGDGASQYIRARIRRIYPPYWFSLLLFVGAYATLSLISRGHEGLSGGHLLPGIRPLLSPGPLLSNLTLAQMAVGHGSINVVAWTLSYEIGFYLIVAAFLLLAMRWGRERLLLNGLHLLTLGALLWLLAFPKRGHYPLDLWPEFGLGVLVYDIVQNSRAIRPWAFFGMAAAAIVALALGRLDAPAAPEAVLTRASCWLSLAFALLIAALYRFDALLSRMPVLAALSFVGAFSYSLYLTHLLVCSMTEWLCKRIGSLDRLHYECVAMSIVLSVPFGYAFFRWCELPFISRRMRSRIEAVARPLSAPEAANAAGPSLTGAGAIGG